MPPIRLTENQEVVWGGCRALRISEQACGTRTQGSWSLQHQATWRGTEKQAPQLATCPSFRQLRFLQVSFLEAHIL